MELGILHFSPLFQDRSVLKTLYEVQFLSALCDEQMVLFKNKQIPLKPGRGLRIQKASFYNEKLSSLQSFKELTQGYIT